MTPHQTEVSDVAKDQYYLGHPFEYWVQKFRESECEEDDRHSAGKALASFGEKSIPYLLEALQNESYWLPASKALVFMGTPATSAVITLLQSSNPFQRKQGVRLLTELWDKGPGFARMALCDALEDENAEVRCEAAQAFRRLGRPLDPSPIFALAKAAKDSDVRVRFWAVQALLWIDSDDDEAMDSLLGALQDADIAVRLAAAESLESVKPTSKKALDALNVSLKDPIEAVRMVVQRFLKTVETESPAEPNRIIPREGQ